MARQDFSTWIRRGGVGAAVLGALASGGSFAYPQPPAGSLLVIQYYDSAARNVIVGQHVNGTCPSGPYPIDYGRQTQYTTFYNYACGSIERTE